MKYLLQILILTSYIWSFGQDVTDATRLNELSYMKEATKVNCDSIEESSLAVRVCLNLKFQKVDSMMNAKLSLYIDTIENDSIKSKILQFHQQWVANRRLQSEVISKGKRGHYLGISYLDCMVNLTERKLEEYRYLLRED